MYWRSHVLRFQVSLARNRLLFLRQVFFVCGRLPLYYLIETIEKDTINILYEQLLA